MIDVHITSKKYNEREILNNIKYVFNDTGLYILKGYNGCGKTTLLRIMALLDTHYEGRIILNKINTKNTLHHLSIIRKEDISYIMPANNLISFLTLKENIKLETNITDDILLKGINLDKKPNQISGGQEILVAISKFLNNNKKIGLLDEVTSQLDNENFQVVIDRLIQASKNKLIILATHDSRVLKIPNLKVLTLEEGDLHD